LTQQDEQKLTLLAIFHYGLGGFHLLSSCLFIFYLAAGGAILSASFASLSEAVPLQALGTTFFLVLGGAVSVGAILSGLMIGAGYFLSQRRYYAFCLFVAGGEAISYSSLRSRLTLNEEEVMSIKTDFPYPIREIENTWISISDGCRLAARIWLPVEAESQPVPAILEYIPYRKNDGTALRDSIRHPYFAGHGYACVRVDMRGSGDSDGILYDEYLPQEQDDALEVLRWIAAQPWCTGAVGIIGKSWGGFNGLQIAARRPPELKAVISLCSTDDRYADDVHYMGGCLLASEMLSWASVMLAYNARPPDPRFVGERWREIWLERLEQSPPFIEAWLRHQRRDEFWQHGSVCENYADITCPVYAVGGWADGYSNAIFRLLSGLPGPRKGLIGPWAHEYPEVALPGPAIGFNQECLRWWDYWLKGHDTGIMDEPMLRVWLQESVPPQTHYDFRPGRWVVEPAWPTPHLAPQTYWLHEARLAGPWNFKALSGTASRPASGVLMAGRVTWRQTSKRKTA
jgi:putative CocE/NonD family hydrolase